MKNKSINTIKSKKETKRNNKKKKTNKMKLKITNIEYNLINKNLLILEDAYKQSNDIKVLNAVKDQIYFQLMEIDGFAEMFEKDFESCQMNSLAEIADLSDKIKNSIEVIKLPSITEKELKIAVKLKEKPLRLSLNGYNDTISNTNLTYYSYPIDDKVVLILPKEDKIIANIARVSNINKLGESLCYFCKQFRKNFDMVHITNEKSSKDNYDTVTQTVCKDYLVCNRSILNTDNLKEFILSLK